MSEDLKVMRWRLREGDEDGVIITDGEGDRCYVYLSEISGLIVELRKYVED